MSAYRVVLSIHAISGRHLSTKHLDVLEASGPDDAEVQARQQFLSRTALVSGVRIVPKAVTPVVTACQAAPGTWVLVNGAWRQVARWQAVGSGLCRLYTRALDIYGPYDRDEGVYARTDIFETR